MEQAWLLLLEAAEAAEAALGKDYFSFPPPHFTPFFKKCKVEDTANVRSLFTGAFVDLLLNNSTTPKSSVLMYGT